MDAVDAIGPDTPATLATLLENHRTFLRYLERRIGDRALAEDILQDAFVKVIDRELDFMLVASHDQERAFKVPSLRNVAERAPYMHAGQLATLADTLDHYNRAPKAPAGHSELEPLNLNATELRQLEAFLRSLSGGTTERRGATTR